MMKKHFWILLAGLIILSIIVGLVIHNYQKQQFIAKQNNQFYYNYMNKAILGTDLITVINKAMDSNDKNAIDKQGIYYQENNENSIKIEIHFLESDKIILMEDISHSTTESFVKYFATAHFECTHVTYHSKTGNIKSLVFEQIS